MNSRIYWSRKFFLTLLWVIVIVAMTVFISIGFSLYYSTMALPKFVEDNNKTVALIGERYANITESDGYFSLSNPIYLTQQKYDELLAMDSVKDIHINTITGAYSENFYAQLAWEPTGVYLTGVNDPYDGGIVIGKVVYISGYDLPLDYSLNSSFDGETQEAYITNYSRVMVEVEELFLYNDVFTDNVYHDFKHVEISMDFYSKEGQTVLKNGDRCIFYIDDYRDSTNVFWGGGPAASCSTRNDYNYSNLYVDGSIRSYIVKDETEIVEVQIDNDYYNFEKIVSREVCHEKGYKPVASKIDGTLEEFLAENQDWQELFNQLEIMNCSLPVVGTDCLETQYAFVADKAKIIAGRSFTKEEYENGEKVVIISKNVATDGGVEVGDKIKISQFLLEEESGRVMSYAEQQSMSYENRPVNINPSIGMFFTTPKFETVDEEFTVVGIYEQSEAWTADLFAFTSNTVFMPKSAQIKGGYGSLATENMTTYQDPISGETYTYYDHKINGSEGIGLAVEIKNGMMDEFSQAISKTDMDGYFLVFDQNYDESILSARLLASMGRNLFIIVAAGWILVLILYVILYQFKQNQTLGTMRSVGSTKWQTFRYIFTCGAVPALVGVTLGTVLSYFVLNTVQTKIFGFILRNDMTEGADRVAYMLTANQMDFETLLTAAVVQILLFFAVLLIFGIIAAIRPPRRLTSK